MTPKESEDLYFPTPSDQPAYPYGLSIRLTGPELDKLQIPYEDLCTGDMIHMHCMGIITSKSDSQRMSGEDSCCVEIQITHISAENEDEEDEEDEANEPKVSLSRITSKLYKD